MKLLYPILALSFLLTACGRVEVPGSGGTASSGSTEVTSGTIIDDTVSAPKPEDSLDDKEEIHSTEESEEDAEEEEVIEEPVPEETPEPSPQEEETLGFSFDTQTVFGEPLTSQVFKDYDLTVMNVWATWCGPCVVEIPYLQEVYTKLPSNVNLIGLCQDGDSANDLARSILSQSGATFHSIILDDRLSEELMPLIRAFPTTLFLDNQGNVVAAVEGVPSGDITASYLSMIDQVLADM
ncbi:MAG: TlpA disulfide reductase family protein [Eubacteriales bacterium]